MRTARCTTQTESLCGADVNNKAIGADVPSKPGTITLKDIVETSVLWFAVFNEKPHIRWTSGDEHGQGIELSLWELTPVENGIAVGNTVFAGGGYNEPPDYDYEELGRYPSFYEALLEVMKLHMNECVSSFFDAYGHVDSVADMGDLELLARVSEIMKNPTG